jgi:hypothetical protein
MTNQRRSGMWVDQEAEVRARMDERVREAERRRLAALVGASPAGRRRRLRRAAGFGLVRTGLRLLEQGRA